jgi:hypothetical protein
MQSGSVIVQGPFIDSGIALTRGQRLRAVSSQSSWSDIKPETFARHLPLRRYRGDQRNPRAALNSSTQGPVELDWAKASLKASSRSCSTRQRSAVSITHGYGFAR